MNYGPASEEAIRIEAYILSEKAGHPSGMEHTFWQQAEAIVHSRLAAGISKPVRAKRAAAQKPPAAPKASTVPKTRKAVAEAKPKAVAEAKPKTITPAKKSSRKVKAEADLSAAAADTKPIETTAPKRQSKPRTPSARKPKA